MKIVVTQQDIDLAHRYDATRSALPLCERCPIALAIQRQTGMPVQVSPDMATIGETSIDLPLEAQDFVAAFDDNVMVEPFIFDLEFQPN